MIPGNEIEKLPFPSPFIQEWSNWINDRIVHGNGENKSQRAFGTALADSQPDGDGGHLVKVAAHYNSIVDHRTLEEFMEDGVDRLSLADLHKLRDKLNETIYDRERGR